MKEKLLVLAVVLIALVGCQAQSSPEEMLAAMEGALNAGDVDAAMAFFTDDAVVKLVPALPPGSPDTYTGAEEIRAWFEELVAMNFEIDVEVLEVEGDAVTTRTSTWMDPTREMGVAPLVATEVYTVRDGKIRSFTWTISDDSLAKVQAAMAPPPETPAPPTPTPMPPTPTPLPPTSTPLPPTAAPTAPPVALATVEDLVGVWERGERRLTFREGGTHLARVAGELSCPGRFWFEGNQLHIEDSSDDCCPAGQIGIYEVQGVPQEYLIITLISESCQYGEREKFFRGQWEWVSSP